MQPNKVRGLILDQIVAFQNGHLASAFSLVEILVALYGDVMHHHPDDPQWVERDRLILSKGHGCSALYAVLAECGYFPRRYLTAPQDGNMLGGHPDRGKVPGVEFATGSLGHGLAVAAGMALAAKKSHRTHRVFCILGDGELQEGSVWEAALFAGHHKLDNLTVIVDYNRHQSSGAVADICAVEPLADKWQAFGWIALTVHGHDLELLQALGNTFEQSPCAYIAYTEKGHGVKAFTEDPKWHTAIPNPEELFAAKKELGLL